VQQVSQSFGMHEPVLSRRVNDLWRGIFENAVNASASPVAVLPDFTDGRPVGRFVAGEAGAGRRVDTGFEEPVEAGLKPRFRKTPDRNVIPIERFQVTEVENEPVPLRDRPLVQGLFTDHIEKLIGSPARITEVTSQVVDGHN
jgi:hypothetical protein